MPAKKVPAAEGVATGAAVDKEDKYRPIEEDYTLGAQLGRGSFGVVCRATPVAGGADVAVKSINRHELFEMHKEGQAVQGKQRMKKKEFRRELEHEIDLMTQIDHKGIVRLINQYNDKANGITKLVLDLCEGPELAKVLADRGALQEEEVRGIMSQMLTTFKYLHGVRVVHRDLKPANIMFVRPLPSGPIGRDSLVKVLDFGLAERVGARRKGKKKWHDQDWKNISLDSAVHLEVKGTEGYRAPELKGELVQLSVRQALSGDVHMLGVIMRELLTGVGPQAFVSHGLGVLLGGCCCGGGRTVHALATSSSGANDFVNKMLAPPQERMSVEQASEHPWMEAAPSEPPAGSA